MRRLSLYFSFALATIACIYLRIPVGFADLKHSHALIKLATRDLVFDSER